MLKGGRATGQSTCSSREEGRSRVSYLVNVSSEGNDARDPKGIGFRRADRGSVHDGELQSRMKDHVRIGKGRESGKSHLGVSKEISGTSKPVEHTRTKSVGGVGVSVHVHFQRGV